MSERQDTRYPYWPEIHITEERLGLNMVYVTIRTTVRVLAEGTWYDLICEEGARYKENSMGVDEQFKHMIKLVYHAQVLTDSDRLKELFRIGDTKDLVYKKSPDQRSEVERLTDIIKKETGI